MRALPAFLAAMLCLAPSARAQEEEQPAEQTEYSAENSSDTQPGENPSGQTGAPEGTKPYSGIWKGGSSGGIPVRPGDEEKLGPAFVQCEQGPDTPARHRPPNTKPFPAESNQYRHWFNSGLTQDGNCCAMAEFEGRDLVWACRRMGRALANSAGCPYDPPRAETGAPAGSVGVGYNRIPLEIQTNIAKIQQTVCEGLAKYTLADPGGDPDENCDAMVRVYRDYIDFVDVALWFKGKFYTRCAPTVHPEKMVWPALPPPPPAK
ncbi:MAG: hypothetical protein NTY77_11725 [Elusimicrobia bacterium]|nr:hypothetical protein [Elusimicrobiota bacterium]